MFSFEPQAHHVEDHANFRALQMGQPSDDLPQRQQTDLPAHGDAHGVERELQFADLDYRIPQAMG